MPKTVTLSMTVENLTDEPATIDNDTLGDLVGQTLTDEDGNVSEVLTLTVA